MGASVPACRAVPSIVGELRDPLDSALRWNLYRRARSSPKIGPAADVVSEAMRDLSAFCFPDPPRRIPAHRALSIAFRTAHLATFGLLLGGHFFGAEPARLVPFFVATVASGAALMALELAVSFDWLFMGKGLAVMLKLVLLALIPIFWAYRLPLLLLIVVVASVGSHMPARFRHYCLRRRALLPPADPSRGGANGRPAMVSPVLLLVRGAPAAQERDGSRPPHRPSRAR